LQLIETARVAFLPSWLGGAKNKWQLIFLSADERDLRDFSDFVRQGKIKPVVDSVFAFEDTMKAYERIMTNRAKGKVVIKVDPTVE
jgi:NADPH:quinone reductase-like Zn-dependent oxidoreductase